MYLLYLDDSGSVKNKSEEYFVLGGICVREHSVRWLAYQIEQYAEQLVPEDPGRVEFHASEIFAGKAFPWDGIKERAGRIQIIKNVLCKLEGAFSDVVVFACAIHKASFPSRDPVTMAFEDLSSRFDFYLQRVSTDKSPHKGIIVLDKSSYETQLQSMATNFRLKGNRWGNQLRQICEVPLFVDSRASRLIQLADHIAYAVFRMYNANDWNYFTCIEGRFDSVDGVMHGLCHHQFNRPNCTCPACITRAIQTQAHEKSEHE